MDPAIISAFTASGSLALNVVNLLISRLDRRVEIYKSVGRESALLDLEQVIAAWLKDVSATNEAAKAYFDGSGSWEAFEYASDTQMYNFFGEVLPEFDPDNNTTALNQYRKNLRDRKLNLIQFLRIHVPDFSEAFNDAVADRYRALADIKFRRPGPEVVPALEQTTQNLTEALTLLQAFIRND